ncbi:multiple sugar transport system permease protein [Micromonospora phaseoli]|uniref:Multiple sugar transport system permease protein n=1 Tax=Micromonospora phaseoli TaxID=1144548 RepID=A0A1H7B1B8_9ACTN|nr:sugar ABC transporter permease [Micromonospora phaseoli]PZV96127.1 carbohydrate ABC transporter membrane protein 1 (CUT1 family) [Micromonospora phaseoli]GIJ79401.1 sugar ABC transporter permease [Micromonospora phaseoli]SEJ70017.1 multiple sugar transport system permease protein [Micromonospora phaseoli]
MAITTVPGAVRAPGRPAPSSPAGPPRTSLGRKVRDNLTGHTFLIGAVLCFAVFSWYPMVRGVVMSFQRTRRGETTWVGWDNYLRILDDPSFWTAWKNTFYFTALALVLGYAVPFFVAILLNEFRHAQGYLRILVYLPVMLPPASALFLFKFYAYDPSDAGLFNAILKSLGLPTSQWMQSPEMTMPAMVIASTWMNMGGAVLIYLASLQNIPGELYEAAELDGAGVWRRIRHVTIPQTRLILALMAMLQIVATMQLFIEPLILANGAGAEDSATSVAYLIYQHGFFQNDLNGAAALGVIMLVVLAGFSAVYLRLTAKQD